ncbi:hypothetical protein C7H19_06090 [Aphanothece hegewaldii CCALA 016]|uniref:Putative restriction endonuclease domain-containing protein n=1 Tax=Aphanothece hegewaldii CCALA 016 TaxID=2107694 RepID=A0A2T1M069_9CHRO|nr:Uma2 family endonuclease [Aphanothece hegewaldii]PSF38042.1 hypothetical protein C7H19_06090 [Aphanothece hegewaldii CCALA 016]
MTISSETAPETNLKDWESELVIPDISHLVIEDDTPVDSLISEKQQRLLVTSLYSSFAKNIPLPFLAAANVGLFYALKQRPLVPDVMLSLDVTVPQDWSRKENRSYLIWEMGKPPEIVIEIVSNKVGNELSSKLKSYANARVGYYAVFDPLKALSQTVLQLYKLQANKYNQIDDFWMPDLELGLKLWQGTFEGKEYTWLRWCDQTEQILLTGDEIAEQERQRAEQERQRAEQERQRAERLAEILRERGINPDEII